MPTIEHMFDHEDSVIGLWPGEMPENLVREEDLFYEIACREMADGWLEEERHLLPADLEDFLPGPYLASILHAIDPARLNGHDAVRLMQARHVSSPTTRRGSFARLRKWLSHLLVMPTPRWSATR